MRKKLKTKIVNESYSLNLDELEFLVVECMRDRIDRSQSGPCLELWKLGIKDVIKKILEDKRWKPIAYTTDNSEQV